MTWNEGRILELLDTLRVHRGDTTSVEVKRAAGGVPEAAASTICAFANMPEGGVMLLGIDEASNFTVVGVADPAAMEAGIVNQARSAIDPAPHLDTYSVAVDGKQVVVVEVTPLRLADRPAVYQGRAYLRQADGDFVMHEHELRMIEVEKALLQTPDNYDLQPVPGVTAEDLVPELVAQYLSAARSRDRRLSERTDAEILRRTGVVTASGEPTLAGLYALGDYPQGQYPSLTVTAAVQLPSNDRGERTRDLKHFTGPVPVLLDELMVWCEQNIVATRFYRADGHMGERPQLPLSAVRELLANALVHRDLSPNTLGIGKQVQVRLTPRALFIVSPGGLRGVSLEQLESEDHAQAAVNQRLYGIAQKLRTADDAFVIEGEGGGIREVFRAASEYGLPTPSLTNTGVQFKATLWLPVAGELPRDATPRPSGVAAHTAAETTAQSPATKGAQEPGPAVQRVDPDRHEPQRPAIQGGGNDAAVLAAIARAGEVTVKELQLALGLTVGQVRYSLNKALRSGEVEMVGGQGRKRTVYRLGR
ncbi:ATP-binding protein [Leucobacter sp. HY1910]